MIRPAPPICQFIRGGFSFLEVMLSLVLLALLMLAINQMFGNLVNQFPGGVNNTVAYSSIFGGNTTGNIVLSPDPMTGGQAYLLASQVRLMVRSQGTTPQLFAGILIPAALTVLEDNDSYLPSIDPNSTNYFNDALPAYLTYPNNFKSTLDAFFASNGFASTSLYANTTNTSTETNNSVFFLDANAVVQAILEVHNKSVTIQGTTYEGHEVYWLQNGQPGLYYAYATNLSQQTSAKTPQQFAFGVTTDSFFAYANVELPDPTATGQMAPYSQYYLKFPFYY